MSLINNNANPALKNGFEKINFYKGDTFMTISGTIRKIILFLIALAGASIVSYLWLEKLGDINYIPFSFVIIGSIILGIITSFVPRLACITGIFYAGLEGILLAYISFYANQFYPGIAMLAVLITILITLSMTLIYAIKPSLGKRFRKAIIGMTLAIGFLYLLTFVLSIFGVSIPYIYNAGLIGMILSIFILIVASLNLLLDLDFIVEMSNSGAPKYMEWYAAFGIMVTLIWIYVRVLDLLIRIFNNKD